MSDTLYENLDSLVAELPNQISVLVHSGYILLPRGYLPIHISGKKHKKIIDYALANNRLLGLLQPKDEDSLDGPVFSSGCLGKITSFNEAEDGSYMIVLTGICRFDAVKDIQPTHSIPLLEVVYDFYKTDLIEQNQILPERDTLLFHLQEYVRHYNIEANWDELKNASDEALLTALTMICPFDPREKQALLETLSLKDRVKLLSAFMEVAYFKKQGLHHGFH